MIFFMLIFCAPAYSMPNFITTENGAIVVSEVDSEKLRMDVPLEWAGDPFQKLPGYSALSQAAPPKLELQATMPNDETPMAIINDTLVKIGSTISGKRLKKVGDGFVLLQEGGSVTELGIVKPGARTPASSPISMTETAIQGLLDNKIAPENLMDPKAVLQNQANPLQDGLERAGK